MEHTQITLFRFYCVFYLYISFMIGYSKHELGTINMLYFRPSHPKTGAILPPPPHLPITATSPQRALSSVPQGGHGGVVQLCYLFLKILQRKIRNFFVKFYMSISRSEKVNVR